ncbi:MAG TPA: hypothetical protein PLY97_05610, partial [Acidocella sp.]|nr:hypothetical protein [Acidocella sp.]
NIKTLSQTARSALKATQAAHNMQHSPQGLQPGVQCGKALNGLQTSGEAGNLAVYCPWMALLTKNYIRAVSLVLES